MPPSPTVVVVPHTPVSVASAPPAQQVASAVARLGVAQGQSRLDLALHPEALGRVTIRIERIANGTATVHVQVERPETLAALRQDTPQLQAALDRAGLPGAGRSVTFALGPAEAPHTAAPPQSAPSEAGERAFTADSRPRDQSRRRAPRHPRPRGAAFPAVNITA